MGEYSAVIGAGTMGLGIAYVLAAAGDTAILVEPDAGRAANAVATLTGVAESAVKRGKLSEDAAKDLIGRISVVAAVEDLPAGTAELVVEAVPERMELKKDLLPRIETHCAPAILATNTSGLSIDELATVLTRPERFLGLHFFNPVWVMPLLEIVRGERTDPAVLESARALAVRIGKEPIVVRNMPGFATSRLGVAIGLEGMRMLEEGVASAEDIDKAMELGYKHPMGPLRLTDLVGLDVRLDIARNLSKDLGPRFEPPQILIDKVAAGELGKKSGKGFYDWS
ncbi:3-hydroxyacyl-CoA dehydrogenase family protein [Sporichthya polymorpha]|uniref:3-hydroxyacyl-CoA dehydrogenase family protein n=1 Tax=Sporichthya polymorpha TaxID=35751 RepID=UPI00037C1B59|nr:3-hydroxyacyl-CoA dehydrogenase family protein [Sporichthya polymorpha]